MGSITVSAATRPRRLRFAGGTLLVAVLTLLLIACEPIPPADGRDLGIEVIDAPTHLALGEQVALTVVVTNHGSATALAARVGYLVPSQFTVNAITGPQVTNCTYNVAIGSCDFGDIAVGGTQTATVTLTGTTAAPAADLMLLANSGAAEPAPDPHPNTTLVSLSVDANPTVDLQVQGELDLVANSTTEVTSRSLVTNRSSVAASGVVVTQQVSAGPTILGTRFQQPLPGGGTATGSCDVVDRTVTCTTDGAPVEPTTDVNRRWILEVDLAASSGSIQVVHTVSSPHPEPVPDPGPNTATSNFSFGRFIRFASVAPVTVGEVFDVTGVGVSDFPVTGDIINISLPPTLEAISVTSGAYSTPCEAGGHCTSMPFVGVANGSIVSMRLRAVSPGPAATVRLSISSLSATIGGVATVQVVDPSIISEIHPELQPVANGVLGASQSIQGSVRSTGSTDHSDVTVTIELSPSIRVDDARWGIAGLPCSVDNSTVTCNLGTVPAYETVTIDLGVTPLSAGSATVTMSIVTSVAQDEPDPVADTVSASFDVSSDFVDLGLNPYSSPNIPVEDVNWNLAPEVKNYGNTAATGTRLVLTLPAGVEITAYYISVPVPDDSTGCALNGQVVTCEIGTLLPGRSARVQVISSVVAGTTGSVETSVSSDQLEPVPDPHANELTQNFTVLAPRADLLVWFSQPEAALIQGRPFILNYSIRNDGPSAVDSAVSTFEVPTGWTINSAEWDRFGVRTPCSVTGTTSTCTTDPVSSDGYRSVYVTVVPSQIATGQELTAGVSSSLPDDDLSNNQISRTFDVIAAEADLGVTADYVATVSAGTTNYVELRVNNSGPADAADTTLTIALPASVQIDDIYTFSDGFTCNVATQALSCTNPLLRVGLSRVRLTVRHTALGEVSYTATVATSTPEVPDVLTNSVEITQTVTPLAASVSGTVLDSNGAPAPQVSVWLYRAGESAHSLSTQTFSDGTYRLNGLPPGQYQVRFLPPYPLTLQTEWFDDQSFRADATVFTAANLGEAFVANAELAVRVLTVIQGTVLDNQGQPAAGVFVSAYRPLDGYIPSFRTTTAVDGSYSLTLQDGEYSILFGPPAGLGLRSEWFDNKTVRAEATRFVATAGGQVIVADAQLSAVP